MTFLTTFVENFSLKMTQTNIDYRVPADSMGVNLSSKLNVIAFELLISLFDTDRSENKHFIIKK